MTPYQTGFMTKVAQMASLWNDFGLGYQKYLSGKNAPSQISSADRLNPVWWSDPKARSIGGQFGRFFRSTEPGFKGLEYFVRGIGKGNTPTINLPSLGAQSRAKSLELAKSLMKHHGVGGKFGGLSTADIYNGIRAHVLADRIRRHLPTQYLRNLLGKHLGTYDINGPGDILERLGGYIDKALARIGL